MSGLSRYLSILTVLFSFLVIMPLLVSCSTSNNGMIQSIEIDNNIITPAATENGNDGFDHPSITPGPGTEKTDNRMFRNISFDSTISDVDRASRVDEAERIFSGDAFDWPHGRAVCIVTVLDIDKTGCETEKGKSVPIELHIDSVIGHSETVVFPESDNVVVGCLAYWFKENDGYTVSYPDGVIPITEEGSQYIIFLENAREVHKQICRDDIEYCAFALTIPIDPDSNLADEEIYRILKLPQDVVKCSELLIERFVTK